MGQRAPGRSAPEAFGIHEGVEGLGGGLDQRLPVVGGAEQRGGGRVVVEAQAMGRPVVATAHGGALETVSPDETGWLVPPGDAEALAATLDHALSLDEEERAALGAQAREAVLARYTTERMCAATLDVYRELL